MDWAEVARAAALSSFLKDLHAALHKDLPQRIGGCQGNCSVLHYIREFIIAKFIIMRFNCNCSFVWLYYQSVICLYMNYSVHLAHQASQVATKVQCSTWIPSCIIILFCLSMLYISPSILVLHLYYSASILQPFYFSWPIYKLCS